jgi:TPR repeat protein
VKRLALVFLAACGGRETKSATFASPEPRAAPTIRAEAADAGSLAPRACLHESKDPLPCTEECDRGIAASCVILAGRVHPTYAIRLYERACELDDTHSCITAARFHASGEGVPPNRPRQMELLARACTLGDAGACSVPAKAYAAGNGVPRDERRANELWQRGCSGGALAACNALGDAGS